MIAVSRSDAMACRAVVSGYTRAAIHGLTFHNSHFDRMFATVPSNETARGPDAAKQLCLQECRRERRGPPAKWATWMPDDIEGLGTIVVRQPEPVIRGMDRDGSGILRDAGSAGILGGLSLLSNLAAPTRGPHFVRIQSLTDCTHEDVQRQGRIGQA
jgi:hypothetical protein